MRYTILNNPDDYKKRFIFVDTPAESESQNPDAGNEKSPETAQQPEKTQQPEREQQPEQQPKPNKEPMFPKSVPEIQTKIEKQMESLIGTAIALRNGEKRKKERNEEKIAEVTKLAEDFKTLGGLEKRSRQKTKQILGHLKNIGQITEEQAQEMFNLHADTENFNEKWNALVQPLQIEKKENLLDTIKSETIESAKLEKKLIELITQLDKLVGEAGDYINEMAIRERTLESYSQTMGIPVEEGRTFRMQVKRPVYKRITDDTGAEVLVPAEGANGEFKYETVYRRATIKKIEWKDLEMDFSDGTTKHIKPLSPVVTVEFEDEWPDSTGIQYKATEEVPLSQLAYAADVQNMTEIIEENDDPSDYQDALKQLKTILQTEVKEGDTFEYRAFHTDQNGRTIGENKTITINKIFKEDDPNFKDALSDNLRKQTFVELDQDVIVGNEPQVTRKRKLSLGEFAKFYKRVNALKPISLKECRKQLIDENKERNRKYNRKAKHFPPILLQPGEPLYTDTDPNQTFRIGNVDDKGNIELTNGLIFTPATFLSWVKNHEIEKMDDDALADRAVDLMPDGDEKEEERKKAKEAAAKRVKNAGNKGDTVDGPTTTNDGKERIKPKSASYFKKLLNNTYVLSGKNTYALAKEVFDFIGRTMDRREKNRVGAVGNMIFSPIYNQLGEEYKRMQQNAENDEVNRITQAMEQYGFGDCMERLAATSSKDELKALLQVMSKKGWIVWGDPVLWKAIDRVGKKVSGYKAMATYDEDLIRYNLDSFYGQNTYFDLKRQNDSGFKSEKSTFQEEARQMEVDEKGGILARMKGMLADHMNGEYVSPARFEGYLHFVIEQGKLSFEDKLYFLMMAMGATCQVPGPRYGRTILTFDRMNEMEAGLLNNFPPIEYFLADKELKYDEFGRVIVDGSGKPVRGPVDKNHVRELIRQYIESDNKPLHQCTKPEDFTWGSNLTNFIERKMMFHKKVSNRLTEKASRNFSNWDHDDMHQFVPHVSETNVEQITIPAGGTPQTSNAGMKNIFTGMNNNTKVCAEEYLKAMKSGDTDAANEYMLKMVKGMRSFIRLHAIVDSRYHHTHNERTRFSARDFDAFAGADSGKKVSTHVREMNQYIENLINDMIKKSPSDFAPLMDSWQIVKSKYSHADRQGQSIQQDEVSRFGEKIEDALRRYEDMYGTQELSNLVGRNVKYVTGYGERADTKASEDEEERLLRIRKIDYEDIKDKAAKIEEFRSKEKKGGLLSKEEIAKRKKSRLENILKRVKAGKMHSLTNEEKNILDSEYKRVQSAADYDNLEIGGSTTTAGNDGSSYSTYAGGV
ncbi:hypothetical protein GF340_06065 [Candidatus Peregrinibacteria bacterium]|nr:hypothetical protein [Candidatus Peregrinibacteria bacterium]